METRAMEEGGLDSLKATELRLGQPGTQDEPPKPATAARGSKRMFMEAAEEGGRPKSGCTEAGSGTENPREAAPAAKAQVVGWPPIRSYRKNCLHGKKAEAETPGAYVKVSMDGAPYLRKVDLGAYSGYKELREALEGMFKCFSLGFSGGDGCGGLEFAITYEDKDGDWMLAGDVPWEMFTRSCKRLRIMKGCEARGLGSSP